MLQSGRDVQTSGKIIINFQLVKQIPAYMEYFPRERWT